MTAFCAHPGCMASLLDGNVSGVCRAHIHGPACRCATCRAPRQPNGKRQKPQYRIRTRAEGLLPGLTTPPHRKGTR